MQAFTLLTENSDISRIGIEKTFCFKRINKIISKISKTNTTLLICFSDSISIEAKEISNGNMVEILTAGYELSSSIKKISADLFTVLPENGCIKILCNSGYRIEELKQERYRNILKLVFSVKEIKGLDDYSKNRLKKVINNKKYDTFEIDKLFSLDFNKISDKRLIDKLLN